MTSPLDLVGTWALRRRLVDRRADVRYAVDGTLRVVREDDTVRWSETGQLRWPGGRAEVSRDYVIVPVGAGWEMRFADGRPFVPWAPGRLVEHPCRADVYCGVVAVDRAATRLRVWWDVTGPAKDQRIVTRCRRS